MKKILSLVLVMFVALSTSSLAFAKGRENSRIRNIMPNKGKIETTIQKGINSIAPGNSTLTNDQMNTQFDEIKKIADSNNTLSKQINTKKMNISKLIVQIRRSSKTLTSDQYTTINSLITSITTETKNINQNGRLFVYGNKLNVKAFSKLGAQDITNIQNTLVQNSTSLTKISGYYDSIISILTVVSTTTPAAITTGAAVTK